MNRVVKAVVKAVSLVVVLLVGFSLSAVISGVARPSPTAPPAGTGPPAEAAGLDGLFSLLLLCVLATTAFSWAILRSRFRGWGLVAGVYLAFFGLGTFMPQIESALFLPRHLPPGFVGRLFAMGAMVAGVFAPAAVWIWGRLGRPDGSEGGAPMVRMRAREWAWRTVGLAAVYVALYLLAGYFIAFRNPDVLAYYDDSDPGSFLAQLGKIWTGAPWFFALQFLRGVLWIAFVLPLIVSFRGGRLELALLVGCLYSVWAVMLLAPNPYMPHSVRMSHLVETSSSNLLFGCLVGWALGRGRERTVAG